MVKKSLTWMASVLFILSLIMSVVSVSAESSLELPQQIVCGSAEVSVNEIDYDQPATDQTEFIALKGNAGSRLDDFEIHLLSSDGVVYRRLNLQGKSISSMGYFLVDGSLIRSVSEVGDENQLIINSADFIVNNAPGAVAIYDVRSSNYCSAVNYGGTTPGFESWLNIGNDREADGAERGCSRTSSTWWSCNRPITPNGSNDTVAVTLQTSAAHTPVMIWLVIAVMALSWQSWRLYRP